MKRLVVAVLGEDVGASPDAVGAEQIAECPAAGLYARGVGPSEQGH